MLYSRIVADGRVAGEPLAAVDVGVVSRVRGLLVDSGVLSEDTATALEQQVTDEIAEAATWAEAEPDAPPEAALLHTWAERAIPALAWMSSA